MLREILNLIQEGLDSKEQKNDSKNEKIVELVEELERLEIKRIDKLHNVERWGDIDDDSDWRTAELRKVERLIEAKKRMIDTLKKF